MTTASGIVTSSSTTPNPLGSTASTSVASSSQATTITRLTTAIPSPALTSTTTTKTVSATGFVLRITATPSGLRRRQSGLQFLGFDANDNSIAVTDPDSAALIFEGDGSTLLSNGMYLGTEVDQEGPVERVSTMPAGFHDWIFVGGLAQLQGTTGFFLGGDGIISAIVSNSTCSNNISLVRAGKRNPKKHDARSDPDLQLHRWPRYNSNNNERNSVRPEYAEHDHHWAGDNED
ncbi:hypothetical protein LTS07_007863 [Exophiala sideris]|uniref:DUF7908 domain-containing protein n=1 Tax=Exophiala sideris TaxID=1016849 RepID=A0ABR0JGH9_9EURO|nr:hypothetical protein LTS07_007863 [Exophiala sideris]KAK5033132.1 hypothetical protein LTR13_007097 [Exophiala sideris]KAK5063617.1 hypothetical protein LTR69_004323 [Exophiala sideris]KAK5180550.1 hypothetical protein LTR44_006864 [Eurotiomycetes sp. CCFEE 6388]